MSPELEAVIAIWQPSYTNQLTEADAKEIVSNLKGFIELLNEWAVQDSLTAGIEENV